MSSRSRPVRPLMPKRARSPRTVVVLTPTRRAISASVRAPKRWRTRGSQGRACDAIVAWTRSSAEPTGVWTRSYCPREQSAPGTRRDFALPSDLVFTHRAVRRHFPTDNSDKMLPSPMQRDAGPAGDGRIPFSASLRTTSSSRLEARIAHHAADRFARTAR